ncbi:MAG TPA: hypothetical protein VKP68_15210, partial [Ramlibacter sp.]|nr:hypothetical protein [Ramlibacter sp.]
FNVRFAPPILEHRLTLGGRKRLLVCVQRLSATGSRPLCIQCCALRALVILQNSSVCAMLTTLHRDSELIAA